MAVFSLLVVKSIIMFYLGKMYSLFDLYEVKDHINVHPVPPQGVNSKLCVKEKICMISAFAPEELNPLSLLGLFLFV